MYDHDTPSRAPRLLERVRDAIRLKHYSLRTEQTYVHWIKRYIYFHDKKHPAGMGEAEVTAFLSHLAVERDVAAATQNQALAALLFLYKEVLATPLPWLYGIERAKRPARLPTVLTPGEVRRLLLAMSGTKWLMASLLYGAGCGCASACRCASRTSTSSAARSSCGTARAPRTGSHYCRIR